MLLGFVAAGLPTAISRWRCSVRASCSKLPTSCSEASKMSIRIVRDGGH